MSDRYDHAAEARRLLNESGPYGVPLPEASAAAQVHATLALVEQQRIANLIAIATAIPEAGLSRTAADMAYNCLIQDGLNAPLLPDVAAALGIEQP